MKLSYSATSYITGAIAFIFVWIYAISQWGFLVGISLGWIPAIITALLAAILWPLAIFLLIIGLLFLIAAIFFTSNFMETETFQSLIYIVGFGLIVYAIVESYKQFKKDTLPKIKSEGIWKTIKESETYKSQKPRTWIALIVNIVIWVGLFILIMISES